MGLVPKKETEASSFCSKYPNYDGRTIRIAILDTGVDPGAKGLQVTSDGKPKIIELIDTTGGGDVDTSIVVKPSDDGTIIGITGRILKIPEEWQCTRNEYHVGVKSAFEMFPASLRDRITTERKENLWDPQYRSCLADVTRSLERHQDKGDESDEIDNELEELKKRHELLTGLDKNYKYLGAIYDCIVFHDGDNWRACIDTSETGDLASCSLVGNYSTELKYYTIGENDMMNYTVNIHNNGNLLEIVTCSGAHGTHVASIAAANFPSSPELNGVAPGAEIVAIKIGDSRLASMETGTALVRAIIKVIQLKCDLVNYSFGESCQVPNKGRIGEIINEAVTKYGIIFVSSAGNDGPALSTIGAPVACNSNFIGIGAYASPESMTTAYSMLKALPGMQYTWSSCGPTEDGHLGVCVTAPGGAITSVPNWTLRSSQLMNGTSMSSPHACGGIGLILSALKSEGISYSPHSIRRAIEHTALKLPNESILSQGHGLLQINAAYSYLAKYRNQIEDNINFHITCGQSKRGIYLRDTCQVRDDRDISISVEPLFSDDLKDLQIKIDFGMNLILTCSSTWVSCPQYLSLTNMKRSFNLRVLCTQLQAGCNTTMVYAYDSNSPKKGAVFTIPIVVIIPTTVLDSQNFIESHDNLKFHPGQIYRNFISVPLGATWAEIRMRGDKARYLIYALQVAPVNNIYKKYVTFDGKNSIKKSFSVIGGLTLEFTVAKWWACLSDSTVSFDIEFHGLKPENNVIYMHSTDAILRVDVRSFLKPEFVFPRITLKSTIDAYSPTECKISCLNGDRDMLPKNRQIYSLQADFNFTQTKAGNVQMSFPLLCEQLYESAFESQLWMLYNSNKQYIGAGDAFPTYYSHMVPKGDYVLKLQIRHDNRRELERLQDEQLIQLRVKSPLTNEINVDAYLHHFDAQSIDGKKITSGIKFMQPITSIFVSSIPREKTPKQRGSLQYLEGTLSLNDEKLDSGADSYMFIYQFCEKKYPVKSSDKTRHSSTISDSSCKESKSIFEEINYNDALRDLKISWIAKSDDWLPIYKDLISEYSEHIPLRVAKLHVIDSNKERKLPQIMEAAKGVINLIDGQNLLAYYGLRLDSRSNAVAIKTDMDKLKKILIDAYLRLGNAQIEYYNNKPISQGTQADESLAVISPDKIGTLKINNIDETAEKLLQFVDSDDSKVSAFLMSHAKIKQRYGKALDLLLKKEKLSKQDFLESIQMYKLLGWEFCENHFQNSVYLLYPETYRLF